MITADPELDDNNSLIRLLLYSCDLQIEGLIYASSGFHWKGDGKGTKWFVPGREYARFGLDTCPCPSWRWAKNERFIHNLVEAYSKVYPNLKTHHSKYPTPTLLRSKIRYGNIDFDGDYSKDSPGSDLIKSLLLDNVPGPLYVTAWGGQSTIARALKAIEEQYSFTPEWNAIRQKVSHKLILLPSGDQDDTYAGYIKPHWPDVEYRQFSHGPNYGYGAQINAAPQDSIYLTADWVKENIRDRGPLGAMYRVWGDGKQMVPGDKMDYFGLTGYSNAQLRQMGYVVWMPVQEKGSWLGEGDDPTFMNMLGNGLRAYEKGYYGGWGGVQVNDRELQGFSFIAADTSQAAMSATLSSGNNRLKNSSIVYPDFFIAAQRDFAGRLKWSVTPSYQAANHAPVIAIQGPLNQFAVAGETIRMNADVADPDRNQVNIKWYVYPMAYPDAIEISNPASAQPLIHIPNSFSSGQSIHLIAEATDNGKPALSSYQRIIITIR